MCREAHPSFAHSATLLFGFFFYENFSCKIDTEVAGSDPAHIKHGKPMAAVSNVEAFENLCLAGQLCLPFHGATAGP